MVKTKKTTKLIIILLIMSLIYANLNMAILGVISYAQDNVKTIAEEELADKEEKALNIEISEITKNDIASGDTEYSETLTVKLNYVEKFNEVTIADISDEIIKEIGQEETEVVKPHIETFYKTTKISKAELEKVIGEKGSLEITYKIKEQEEVLEPETEKEEEKVLSKEAEKVGTIILPEVIESQEEETILTPEIEEKTIQTLDKTGTITAKEGIATITAETTPDDEGYITIIYPENTISIDIKILANTNNIEKLEIVNNKLIPKQEKVDDIKEIQVIKQIIVKGEKELLNTIEKINKPINYAITKTGFGIDKNQIATAVANKINFTITMYTDKTMYDLYKNPYFVIELPQTIKEINLESMAILNNPCFELGGINLGTLENGNKAIAIKLQGEQKEHTKSVEEDVQIVLGATITTEELLPTTQNQVSLHYQNENATTYDGIGIATRGIEVNSLDFVSNREVIVETKAIVGEQTISSPREKYNTVNIEPHTYQSVKIIGTAINNTGKTIQNAKILGTVTNIGPILGAENVYYSENENATIDLKDNNNKWQKEYTANAKKYLLIIKNFVQAQTVNFEYNMNLPENIMADTQRVAMFEVYNDNNQKINTSKITINQIAERFDIYEDENIKANIVINNAEKLEIGDDTTCRINITNVSGKNLENVSLNIEIPKELEVLKTITKKNDTEKTNFEKENSIQITNLNMVQGETVTVEIETKVLYTTVEKATVVANINCEQKQEKIFYTANIVPPSLIETTITSNKLGETLEARDNVEYIVTLKNKGKSHAEVDIKTTPVEGMYIQKIEFKNLSTGKTRSISCGNLSGDMKNIEINPEETVEVRIKCFVKELEKDTIETMKVEVTGEKIKETKTQELVNKIDRKIKQDINNGEQIVTVNTITGTAWIDQNENGKKDEEETVLKGIQAVLINTQTSKEVEKTVTNNQGEYSFNNIDNGKYIVEFRYNTNDFNVTEYKNKNISKELSSAVINTTQNNKTTAKTEVITLQEGKTENINAGFVMNKKFDMSINKGITQVKVNNEQGTKEYEFNNNSMAKVEIDGKYLKGSLIFVEYEIAVTNIGEVKGYAKLVSDKIPTGMKFTSELNTDWYEGEDGKIYSVALANKELQPGETATIKLILIKEMTDDKIVSPVNIANIEETFNEYLIADKNSNNNSSEATIIISLTTGQTQTYIWLILTVIAIIGVGAFGTKKIISKDIIK